MDVTDIVDFVHDSLYYNRDELHDPILISGENSVWLWVDGKSFIIAVTEEPDDDAES
jgi:hypothetical protein